MEIPYTAQESVMLKRLAYSAETLNGFLRRLHVRGAVKIDTDKGFRLKLHERNPAAPLSPLYFNLRIPSNKGGPLIESDVQEIASFFYAYLAAHDIAYDAICPVPNAGDPFAKELQRMLRERQSREVPLIHLLKEEAPEGRHIGGINSAQCSPVGARVLLIDDLISEAGSKVEAIASLRREGCIVTHCLVFLDRDQGGARSLQHDHGVVLHSVVNLKNVLDFYKDSGLITALQYEAIHAYLKSAQ